MRPLHLFLAAGTLALVLARVSAAAPLITTPPDWLTKPTAATVENSYPAMALQMSLSGRATIHCHVDEVGKLRDCRVTSELPEGLGFGQGALAMASAFQMRPRTVDGRAVEGELNVPITFKMPPAETLPASPPPTSAQALAAARKLVAVLAAASAGERAQFEDAIRILETESRPDITDDARLIVAKAMRESYPKQLAAYQDTAARLYASAFTAGELVRVLAFYQTPVGKALLSETDESRAQMAEINAAYVQIEQKAAGEAFCATHRCAAGDDAAPEAEVSPPGGLADPAWSQEPARPQIDQAMPPLAKAVSLGGAVHLICVVADTGVLKTCAADREAPEGLGFARAAIGLAAYYQLNPTQIAGGAAGKTVGISIRFRAPLTPDDAADFLPRSPDALALARKLVAAQGGGRDQLDAWRRVQNARPIQEGIGVTVADRDAVLDALAKGAEVANTQIAERRAALLTLRLTDAEITAATAFWLSPAGESWKAKSSDVAALTQQHSNEFGELIWRDAGQALCQTRPCYLAGPPQASSASSAPSTRTP